MTYILAMRYHQSRPPRVSVAVAREAVKALGLVDLGGEEFTTPGGSSHLDLDYLRFLLALPQEDLPMYLVEPGNQSILTSRYVLGARLEGRWP